MNIQFLNFFSPFSPNSCNLHSVYAANINSIHILYWFLFHLYFTSKHNTMSFFLWISLLWINISWLAKNHTPVVSSRRGYRNCMFKSSSLMLFVSELGMKLMGLILFPWRYHCPHGLILNYAFFFWHKRNALGEMGFPESQKFKSINWSPISW